MRYTSLSLAAAIALGFTASAQAGGYVAPVVEPEPVTPVVTAPVAGVVERIVIPGTAPVEAGDLLLVIRPAD